MPPANSSTMSLRRLVVVTCLGALVSPVAVGADPVVEASDNVTVVGRHDYVGGTEIGFAGDHVYAAQINGRSQRGTLPQQGGVFIYDVSDGRFELAGQLYCPGYDNYVEAVRPGLIVVAHHRSASPVSPDCNPATPNNGMMVVDVSDPSAPSVLGGVSVSSAHTLTVHPSGDYVYVSNGGLPGNGDMLEYIVDISDPTEPFVANTFRGAAFGCHDLSFDLRPSRELFPDLAFCAGGGEIQTWDVSNPVEPLVIGRTTHPYIQFPHNAVVSPDGRKLVVNDEAFGLHECETGTSLYGSLWIFDITVPSVPVAVGRIAPPTSRSTLGTLGGWSDSWCAAHNYNFIPGTDYVVSSWFTGGTTVHDISDPLMPRRVAYYKPSNAIAYTAHWYEGRIYVNDSNRGLEVLEVDDLDADLTSRPDIPISWPRIDRTSLLVPASVPARPQPPADRTVEGSLFCVILPTPDASVSRNVIPTLRSA